MSDLVTVLMIEDVAVMREAWKRCLEPLQCEILEAGTLREAMELMRKIPPPDFIFLDLNLPDSRDADTLRAIEDLRRLNPRCVVIVLTGLTDEKLRTVAAIMGADLFEQKQDVAQQNELWAAMKTAIEQPTQNRAEPPFEHSLALLERINALICSA